MPKITTAKKSRKWCFTLFYKGECPGPSFFDDWTCDYLVVGKEVCPTTGREHMQGYVRFANPHALAGVNKLAKAHWEPCKGTEQDNFDYCTKEEDRIIEWGEREKPDETDRDPKQGKRNDIAHVRELVQAGASMEEVVCESNSYQAIRMAETMLKYFEQKRSWIPNVVWIWGPTGTGKSHMAHNICGADDAEAREPWISGVNGRWFEGYDGHEKVIIDDFRHDWCDFHVLLRLLDRYPYRVEVKGGSRQFLARWIVITSPFPPDKVYPGRIGEDVAQLLRRITRIVHLTQPYVAPAADFAVPAAPAERGTEQKSGVIIESSEPPLMDGRVGALRHHPLPTFAPSSSEPAADSKDDHDCDANSIETEPGWLMCTLCGDESPVCVCNGDESIPCAVCDGEECSGCEGCTEDETIEYDQDDKYGSWGI